MPGLRRYPRTRRQFGGSPEAGTGRGSGTGERAARRTHGAGGRPSGGQEGPAFQALGPEGAGGREGNRPRPRRRGGLVEKERNQRRTASLEERPSASEG